MQQDRQSGPALLRRQWASLSRVARIAGKFGFYPWLDFGGSTGRGHRVGVPWTGSIKRALVKGGRYVYPTIEEARADIEDQVGDVLIGLASERVYDAWR